MTPNNRVTETMNYEKTTQSVIDLVKEVGEFLVSKLNSLSSDQIVSKGKMDFVTVVDKEAEKRLVKGLDLILPDSGFIAEEGTSDKKGERYNWIIDPLDGTTNYIHGVSPFCISIALQEMDELVAGIIYDPMNKECFYANKNMPAFLTGNEIRVSHKTDLAESLIATGFPYTDFSRLDEYMESLREFMKTTHGIRRLGSAAIDLAYVACGRYDAFYEYHLKPWDVAAGTVLIRQAGGKVCDFQGEQNFLFGESYVGTNYGCHDEFMKQIQKFF